MLLHLIIERDTLNEYSILEKKSSNFRIENLLNSLKTNRFDAFSS